MKSRSFAIGLSGAGLDDELLLIANEQLVFPAVVNAGLPRQLAVVVEHGVQRHVRIGNVVADDRREKTDVALRVRPVLVQRLEAANQPAGDFVRAPRHQAVLPELVDAVLLQRLVVLARQVLERIRAVGVEVEEMVRRLFGEAGVAPQIRIDRTLDDERPVRLEKRAERLGKDVDGARDDELVRLESPGAARSTERAESQSGRQSRQHAHTLLSLNASSRRPYVGGGRSAVRDRPRADSSVRDAADLHQEREPVARAAAAARRNRRVQGRRDEDRHLAHRRARQLPHQSRDDERRRCARSRSPRSARKSIAPKRSACSASCCIPAPG